MAKVARFFCELLCVAIVTAVRAIVARIRAQFVGAALEALRRAREIAARRHATGEANRGQRRDRQSDSLRCH
jgi:hypothetical protein